MEQQRSNSSLKAIIIILSILLIGSLVVMYSMSTKNEKAEKELVSEKETLLTELKKAKADYDAAIAEKTGLSDELIAARANIEKLIAEVEKSKGDVASLTRYKTDYRRLKGDYDRLMAENTRLKEENGTLTVQRDSTATALGESKKYIDTLASKNDNLSKTIEKAQKLTITNVKTESYKEKSSGKLVSTDKARRVDKIKITFTVAGNEVAMAGEKTYYVQVIDPKNNVIGDKKTEVFGDYTLTYSFITTATYQNKTMDISQMIPGKDFEKGLYHVNVFDKGVVVGNATFTLR